MKIVFSRDVDGDSFRIEANEDEGGIAGIRSLADNFENQMQHAYDAAHMVWEAFPEFRQVTFDTLTDSEHLILARAKKTKTKMN